LPGKEKMCMARPVKIDDKRKELLTKAVACFTRHGYSKTTLDDVAKETGINKASLYHYFKNKEALFLQVILEVSTAGIEELKANTLKTKQPEKQIIVYFSERLHYYLQLVRLNGLSKETLLHLQGMFDAVYEPVRQKEIAWIADILKKAIPGLTATRAANCANLLFDTADAIKHNAVFTGNLLQGSASELQAAKKQIAQTITMLLKGIQA
jgi:AcrR family transcriptional regulator